MLYHFNSDIFLNYQCKEASFLTSQKRGPVSTE